MNALITCGRVHVWLCAQMCAHGPRCRSRFFFWASDCNALITRPLESIEPFSIHIWYASGQRGNAQKKGKKEVHWCPWRKSGQPNGSFEDYFAWGASLWDCAWGARRPQRKLCNILRDKTWAAKTISNQQATVGLLKKKLREELDIRSSAEVDPVLHSGETSHLKNCPLGRLL